MNEERIKYLEKKLKDSSLEGKYTEKFNKQSRYLGGGTYEWMGLYSNDTRVLFLMGVLTYENIKFKTT